MVERRVLARSKDLASRNGHLCRFFSSSRPVGRRDGGGQSSSSISKFSGGSKSSGGRRPERVGKFSNKSDNIFDGKRDDGVDAFQSATLKDHEFLRRVAQNTLHSQLKGPAFYAGMTKDSDIHMHERYSKKYGQKIQENPFHKKWKPVRKRDSVKDFMGYQNISLKHEKLEKKYQEEMAAMSELETAKMGLHPEDSNAMSEAQSITALATQLTKSSAFAPYQQKPMPFRRYFLSVTPGLEKILEKELEFLQMPFEMIYMGKGHIWVGAPEEFLWKAVMLLRSCEAVRVGIGKGPFLAFGERELMQNVQRLANDWHQYLIPLFRDQRGKIINLAAINTEEEADKHGEEEEGNYSTAIDSAETTAKSEVRVSKRQRKQQKIQALKEMVATNGLDAKGTLGEVAALAAKNPTENDKAESDETSLETSSTGFTSISAPTMPDMVTTENIDNLVKSLDSESLPSDLTDLVKPGAGTDEDKSFTRKQKTRKQKQPLEGVKLNIRVKANCATTSRLTHQKMVAELVTKAIPVRIVDIAECNYQLEKAAKKSVESTMQKASSVEVEDETASNKLTHLEQAKCDLQNLTRLGSLPAEQSVTDVRISIHNNKANLVVDGSGDMSRRQYRANAGEMPLSPTLAAACVMKAEPQELLLKSYAEQQERQKQEQRNRDGRVNRNALISMSASSSKPEQPLTILWDPFCGSGTIVLEALSFMLGHPVANPHLNFPFHYFPCHNTSLYEDISLDILDNHVTSPMQTFSGKHEMADETADSLLETFVVLGSDISLSQLTCAWKNFGRYLRRMPRHISEYGRGSNPFLGATYLGETMSPAFINRKSVYSEENSGDIFPENELTTDDITDFLFNDKIGKHSRQKAELKEITAKVSNLSLFSKSPGASLIRTAIKPISNFSLAQADINIPNAEKLLLSMLEQHWKNSGVTREVQKKPLSASSLTPENVQVMILTNVPYGNRRTLSTKESNSAYEELGKVVQHFGKKGVLKEAYCVSARQDFKKITGVDWRTDLRFSNAGIPVELLRWNKVIRKQREFRRRS